MTHPLTRSRLALILPLLALALATGGAHARDKKHNHEVARAALMRGDILPLTKILAIAAQRAPGEVIDVELEEEKGRMKYDLKILTKGGRVLELELDAKTGATLKLEED